ncbi:hypothetical protein ENSA5_35580 [Enhygromyxa salina]|uniref:Uncharacterized protein n=1 Tax=Enhygromyxa salina TaxID=215803 RepID=A0A2S9XVC4_9BACT|nr:hypothetical protein ENSA5_35580 [Enhygromyxa salina]
MDDPRLVRQVDARALWGVVPRDAGEAGAAGAAASQRSVGETGDSVRALY